jgi:hypothetical protein
MIAELANVKKLSHYADLNLIEAFAERFARHPDEVYDNTSFDTIILFNEKWKDQAEYQERYNAIEKMMSNDPTKK